MQGCDGVEVGVTGVERRASTYALPRWCIITVAHDSVFRGDNDELVDQLIAACREHRASPATPLPGFGRALKPYFADEECVPLPSGNKQRPYSMSHSDDSCSKRLRNRGTSPKKVTSTKRFSAPPFPGACHEKTMPFAAPACPGIFSSPNPRELPTPSMTLFKRATSPSSGASMTAHQPQMLLVGAA
eukprot:gene7233-341_t